MNDAILKEEVFFQKLNSLTPQQIAIYNSMSKKTSTAVLLAAFLGGFGAHRFYLDRPFLGIWSILFCWTLIPAIAAFFFLFMAKYFVREYNVKLMDKLTRNDSN
jgi:TM2 domain-containing membrane protein YozV